MEQIRQSRDGLAVLDGLSLLVEAGEFLVVVGPSGAGKTQLGRILTGLDQPDSGTLRLDEREITGLPPSERKFAYVAHEDGLWPHMTAAENVGFVLSAKGVARREVRARVEEALAAAGADGLGDRHPRELSPLRRRRVALARALIGDPLALVLDDPFSGLDPPARVDFREELRRVHRELHLTTILLTRHPKDAFALADRLAVIDLGRIVQSGTPSQVYHAPRNVLVAQLLGPANLIQGHAESIDSKGGIVVRTPLGRLVGTAAGDPPAPGAAVTIAIRPETIQLGGVIPTSANRVAVACDRQEFLGALWQVHLRGPGEWPLFALAPPLHVGAARPGQNLTIGLATEHVVVLAGR
jgi:ABC-type Fe3+/spermidine/putrescine transport system ATPase subunit